MNLVEAWIENLKAHRLEASEAIQCVDHSIPGWPHPWTSELHEEEAMEVFLTECVNN